MALEAEPAIPVMEPAAAVEMLAMCEEIEPAAEVTAPDAAEREAEASEADAAAALEIAEGAGTVMVCGEMTGVMGGKVSGAVIGVVKTLYGMTIVVV